VAGDTGTLFTALWGITKRILVVWSDSPFLTYPSLMVAQSRYFSSRRHVDLRRVGTAVCRRPA